MQNSKNKIFETREEFYTLYLSFKYFSESNQDKKKFWAKLQKEFSRITNSNLPFLKIRQKLISSSDNNVLFYEGLEDSNKTKLEDKFLKIFNVYSDKNKFNIIKCKTYPNKSSKNNVLLSILLIDTSYKIDNKTHHKYILYPIKFVNHSK